MESAINENFEEGYRKGYDRGFKEGQTAGIKLVEDILKARLETNPKTTVEKDQLKNLIGI